MIKVKTAKVNDKEAINNLNELSNMYYTWGYSIAKENKEYFEEKGPVLVKRMNQNKR